MYVDHGKKPGPPKGYCWPEERNKRIKKTQLELPRVGANRYLLLALWQNPDYATKAISRMNAVKLTGPDAYTWRGGISNEPWPFEFNFELKERIRARDGYRCQLCGVPQIECIHPLDVHHIDYDKANLSDDDLISLCVSCHARTNHNRVFWVSFFAVWRKIRWQMQKIYFAASLVSNGLTVQR